MELITGLNRERNQQISTQARALNTLLLNHGITPIFLKGTGNLLAGLYTDIAERMIGDIDFILPKDKQFLIENLEPEEEVNSVLDLACGNGILAKEVQKQL